MKAVREIERKYYKYSTEINADIVGSPSINGTVVSGFSASSYLTIPYIDFVPSNYESVIKFTTPSSWRANVTTECIGLNSSPDYNGYLIVIMAGKGTAQIGSLSTRIGYGASPWSTIVDYGEYILNNNTTYWVKTTWDGSTWKSYISTNGKDYTKIGSLTDGFGTLLTSKQILGNSTGSYAGNNYFTGSIDLSGCYIKLDNQTWWNGVKIIESTIDDYDYYVDIPVYKVVREIERKYYKWTKWTQPVLTSNNTSTSLGSIVTTASTYFNSNTQPYMIMTGTTSTTTDKGYWQLKNKTTEEWLNIKFPYKLKISALSVVTRPSDNYNRTFSVYAGIDGEQIGSNITPTAGATRYTIVSGGEYITDNIFIKVHAQSTHPYFGLQNLQITAQYAKYAESSDYDYYVDTPTYYAIRR